MTAFRVLALAALLLAAHSAGATGVLHRPLEAEPETLDPAKSSGVPDSVVETDLFEGLVRLDPDENVLPGVAASWERAPDGVTYTFHLRPDARWSNGDPVTAQDFVYAWRRTVDPATAAADIEPLGFLVNARAINAGTIKDLTKLGVEAVDDHTLRAVTDGPVALFLKECNYRFTYPVHRATIEKWGHDWTQPEHMVANGPFVLKAWVPQGSITLTRSPTYWDRAAISLDEVDDLITETDATGMRRFQNNELDFYRVPTRELLNARATMQSVLRTGPMNAMHEIFFNMKSGVLADSPKLRRALALATDVDAIVTKIMPRGQHAAYGWVPPTARDYTPQVADYAAEPMSQRIAEAQKLYADSGYGPDHPLALTMNYATFEDTKTILSAVAQMWKTALGVEVTLDNEEFQTYLGRVNRADYQVGYIGWNAGLRDPQSFLDVFESDKTEFNNSHYSNPKVDALLKQAAGTLDTAARAQLYEQVERIVNADVTGVPTQFDTVNYFVSPRVHGWDNRFAYPPSRWLSITD